MTTAFNLYFICCSQSISRSHLSGRDARHQNEAIPTYEQTQESPSVIAENLSGDKIQVLKRMFMNMDMDKNGTLTYDKLKNGLARLRSKFTESEVRQLIYVLEQ
ncbi:unnamed protein product [Lactuca virosa]|uniref:EF-hand domain-containing protein n=1 Tax=Lactuca virosa TaxID=75947 RepID=A0AAU9LQB6_9ASTR|nr:unnamed protein product [Lactuca virosa]